MDMNIILLEKASELDRIQDGAINDSATYERFMRLKLWIIQDNVDDDEFVSLALFIPNLDYSHID